MRVVLSVMTAAGWFRVESAEEGGSRSRASDERTSLVYCSCEEVLAKTFKCGDVIEVVVKEECEECTVWLADRFTGWVVLMVVSQGGGFLMPSAGF